MTIKMAIKFEAYYRNENNELVINDYTVEHNALNFEIVSASRHTRAIEFVKMFDFEFEKAETIPFEMIDSRIWLALLQNGGLTEEVEPSVAEVIEETETITEESAPPVAETPIVEEKKEGKYTITHNNVTYYFTNKRKAVKRLNEMKKEYPSENLSMHLPS